MAKTDAHSANRPATGADAKHGAANAPNWIVWAFAAVVFATTFCAFIPALNNQFLDWDDNTNFTGNASFRGLAPDQVRWMFGTFFNGHYQPITWLTLGWDCVWGGAMFGEHPRYGLGMDPRAFHLSNNMYHAFNTVMVYLLALRLLACALMNDMRARSWTVHIAAAFAAVLFGVHPLRVENVAWITERRDLVSASLLLLTVLTYLRAVRPTQAHRWRWLAISVVIYIVSLLAKVSGAPLAVVLLAIDWYPLRRFDRNSGVPKRIILIEKVPFLAAGLCFSYIAARYQSENGWMFPFSVHPLDARILVCSYGLVFYAWKTFAPFNLLPLYELLIPMDTSQARFIVAPLLVGVLSIAILILMFTRRLRGVVVAALCYAAFLAPVLGFFQNGPQLVADRYAYLPSIGLMMLIAGGAAWWVARPNSSTIRGRLAIGTGFLCAVLLSAMTWQQCKVWRTSETLWTYQLSLDPNCAVGNFNMGNVLLLDRKQPLDAVPYFRKAVALDPKSKKHRTNLRVALREAHMTPELVQAWLDEAALFGADPSFRFTADFHRETGTQALLANMDDVALEHLTVSVALKPNQPQAWNNLAMVYDRLGRTEEAIVGFRRSIELDPKLPNPRYGLAASLANHGRSEEAARELEALLQINPDDAKAKSMLSQLRRGPKADMP